MLLKAAKFERRRFYSVGLPRLAQRSGILNFATSAPYRVIVRPLPLAVSWAAYSRRMLSSPAQRASAAAIEACELIQELARNTTHRPVGEITREAMRNLDAAIDGTLKSSSEGA